MPERPVRSSLPKGQEEEVVGSEALCLVVGSRRETS